MADQDNRLTSQPAQSDLVEERAEMTLVSARKDQAIMMLNGHPIGSANYAEAIHIRDLWNASIAPRSMLRNAGGWTGLAAELFNLHRAAYPAPWCWEQCGDKCDDPVIGVAWWEDDDDCTPIAGEVTPPENNIDRALYREPIALEMQSHADGSAASNARLIVWLRNHVTEILNGLALLTHPTTDTQSEQIAESANCSDPDICAEIAQKSDTQSEAVREGRNV